MSPVSPTELPEPPIGEHLFTFVFTDIEGSSVMNRTFEDLHGHGKYEELRDVQRKALLRHVTENHGWEAQRAGDGHFFVFVEPHDAFKAVIAFQQEISANPIKALLGDTGNTKVKISVRVGIHQCVEKRKTEKTVSNGRELYEFPGSDTNFAARVGSLGVGGQVLVSEPFVQAIWGKKFPASFGHIAVNDLLAPYEDNTGLVLRCWPSRRLKSFDDPSHLFEVLYDDATKSEKREPGSRFFPEFYISDANRYIERTEEENKVYAALGFDKEKSANGFSGSVGGALAIVEAEGGMGKTRLAVTCAVRAAGEFPDGVYFVPLSMLQNEAEQGQGNSEFLVRQILGALPSHRQTEWGLAHDEGKLPELPTVVAALKNRHLLLVLDNFESLNSDAINDLLLPAFPNKHLHFLLTTRADPGVTSLGGIVSLQDGMDEKTAFALAVTRLRQKKDTAWNPTRAEEESVREIIRLTGFPITTQADAEAGKPIAYGAIPLAIELAVGRVNPDLHLSSVVTQLRASPLGEFSASAANLDDAREYKRHHSVTDTLDWSYGLLGETAKRVFAASGLFATSFTTEALLAVSDADSSQITILTGSSLFRRAAHDRYTLHNLSRAYARLRLLGGTVVRHIDRKEGAIKEIRPARADAPEICQRLVDWYSNFVAERLDGNGNLAMNTPEDRIPFERERENFIGASEVLCRENVLPPASANCLLGNFGQYLGQTGAWSEEENWYLRFADFTYNTTEEDGYAWAKGRLANVYEKQGQYDEAIQNYKESLAIFLKISAPEGEAANLYGLATVYVRQGHYDEAVQAYEKSREISRRINNPKSEAATLLGLANVYENQGRYDQAVRACEKSLAIYHKINIPQGEAAALNGLANVYERQGRHDEAIQNYKESHEINCRINHTQGEAITLHGLANAYVSQGRHDEAIQDYERSLIIRREINDPQGEAATLHGLANAYVSQGRYDEAAQAYKESHEINCRINEPQGEAATLYGLAGVFFKQGNVKDAINFSRDAANRLLVLGDFASAGITLKNLALFLSNDGQREQAIAAAEEAVAASAKTQDEIGKQEAAQLLVQLQNPQQEASTRSGGLFALLSLLRRSQ